MSPAETEISSDFLRIARSVLPAEPVICDVGSRDAKEAVALMNLLHGRELHVFEPNPPSAAVCRETLAGYAARSDKRVFFEELAVSNEAGSLAFFAVDTDKSENKDPGFSSALPINPAYTRRRQAVVQREIQVAATTLDEYFRGKTPPDLLWIDVEGFELQVLQGATRILGDVGAIHAEISFRPMQLGKALFWEIEEYLKQRGFALAKLIGMPPLKSFLYRHRLLPNLPWRANAVFTRVPNAR